MTPGRPRNGRTAVLSLIAGSLFVCLSLLGWLWPSLRRYESHSAGGPPAPSSPDSTGSSRSLLGAAEPETRHAGTVGQELAVAEASEGEGRVRIEPAPFQPPPQREAPPELPSIAPPPPAASPAPGEGGGDSALAAASGTAGGGVDAPVAAAVLEPPVVLKAAWLRYPEEARRRRLEGSAEVRILVAETGGVRDVELVTSAGDTSLDAAALRAARATLFRPAHLGAEAVAVWYNYRFVFSVPSKP